MRRFGLAAAMGAAAVTGALALAVGAGAAGSLPTMTIALTGVHGVTVSAATIPSGAVNVVTTFKGKAPSGPNSNGPTAAIVRLDPGVTVAQAAGAVNSHHGDLNALDPYGALIVDTGPGTVQTVLTPGSYVALNITSNGQPAFAPFTVTQSSSPAALPRAAATQTAIEFGFRGPTVLHDGTTVRAVNAGYLVHMIVAFRVRSAAAGRAAVALLRAGKDGKAMKLATGQFIAFAGPVSPGGMQQAVLHAKPGYYVEACFMDTQDGREHTRLGMERLIKVVK